MAFTKFASLEVLEVRSAPTRVRTASLSKFADFDEYRTDDGYMYVRVRAISSRVNKNHDGWPSSELSKAYRTFIGKPIFVDHHNHDPKRARGVIVDAALHVEDEKTSSLDPYYASAPAEHLPPTWIELLLEVDAKAFPRLAKAVINDEIDGVSMGANVEMSKCSHCGNEARSPEQFCKHVQAKGAYFDYTDPRSGQKTSKRSYEDCYDIGFFEISFVFDPADETALKMGDPVYAKKLAKIAAIRNEGLEKTSEYKYVKQRGDKWVITQKGTGKVLSEHDSEEDAKSAFRAMEMHMHSSLDGYGDIDLQNLHDLLLHAPDALREIPGVQEQLQTSGIPLGPGRDCPECGQRAFDSHDADRPNCRWCGGALPMKTAERNEPPQSEMTKAPEKVNTLRQEQDCPVCGSTMEDGVCEVCNYQEPPEGFDNPDLNAAKGVDQQMRQDDAAQAAQGVQTPQGDVTPPPPGGPQPMPGGAMPATASGSSTSNVRVTGAVTNEKTAATSGGRINTQERPILPATRQLSDKPIAQKTVSEAKKPVESKTNKENMTDTIKTADGATPQGDGVQAEKRVDVEGVGAVSGDPLSGIEHENVEKNTGDFTGPHTDTWSAGEGDALGQQDPVTSETGDFFTVSNKTSAEAEDNAGEDAGSTGGAETGGKTWDKSDAGFPDHDPSRVDVAAPLKEEVGAGTETDSNEQFRSLKHTEPVTKDNANDLGGPIGTAIASAKARQLKAFKLVEAEVEAGLTEAASKWERVAELESKSEETLDELMQTVARVKTAGLKKTASAPAQKTAGATRMPSFKAVTAGFEIEAHSVEDDEFGLF